jgi:hypothetical protein
MVRLPGRTFGDTALQAGVERIARKERQQLWLILESAIVPVVIDESLESGIPADGLGGRGIDVVNIVIMQEPQIWRGRGASSWRVNGLFFLHRTGNWSHLLSNEAERDAND